MGIMRTFVSILAILLCGCIAPVDDNIESAQLGLGEEDLHMPPLIPVGPAAGGPFTSIDCPVDGASIVALDIRRPVAALLQNDALQQTDINTRVLRAGDTMTGLLTITPSGTTAALVATAGVGSGQAAIQSQGDANFPAYVGTSPSGDAYVGTGGGNGAAFAGTGGVTGPGFDMRPGTASTAVAPTYAGVLTNGGTRYAATTVSPNATVDPGFNFAQFPQNIVTSSAIVTSDTFTVDPNGFNVATFAGTALGVATITFARALPGNDYRMHIYPQDGYDARWNGVQNVGNFQFVVRDMTTNATVDLTTTSIVFSVSTIGY